MNEELTSFAASLIEDTQMMMDEYPTPVMAFTAAVLDKIEELPECKEIIKEHCKLQKSNGDIKGEIHAYSESVNGEVLYLFYTDYNPSHEVRIKSNSECQTSLNRPQGFYNAAIRGSYIDLDSSSSEYRATKFIYENIQNYKTVNLVVLSNYIINNLELKRISIASKPVYSDVWDLKKIYGNCHSLKDHLEIDIDFCSDEYNRYKIPFIQMESAQYNYKCIQAMFPAKLLYQLYEKYNTQLLYNNVRYFLGLKGGKDKKPNVAMQETLRKENEMFLAYNNGITALAQGIESDIVSDKTDVSDPDSSGISQQYISMGILKKIMDFRIINGGQTTAVIFNAKNNSTSDPSKKVNLLGVFVQVKLIISDKIEKISENITMYSNFQNKVKYSDFSVSNTFNMKMEELSRNTKIPNPNNEPIYWFYERLRGQYDEERKRLKTKQDVSYFEFQYKKTRKFTKEDVAKIWCNWEQSPFDSVKGASTTYSIFMKDIQERQYIPNEIFYKHTIALLIIYKYLMSRPENKNYANGKATVVAYAIAMLKLLTFNKLDLVKIWNNQSISNNLKIFLNDLCDRIYSNLYTQSSQIFSTVLSYGKTKGAYEFIKSQNLGLDIHLLDEDLV